ncbi:hypothetical protein [Candidatus Deferrimicrobium sp.]|uniref:hypothetical protein n=1 Tax=Candidatus Deferrimicrobium sp. TaxID=3060586 RepID=UPI002ED47036
MFSALKAIVDLIRSGLSDFRKIRDGRKRKEIVLGLLRAYFLLKGCVDDGEKLLEIAGIDPTSKIRDMESGEAVKTIEEWDAILRRQGHRLYVLQGLIFGQDHIAVINPDLQCKIGTIVGYKMDRAVTLHGIGAALFFRNMFPQQETQEDKARLISMMLGAEDNGALNLEASAVEIGALRRALDEYRSVVERFVSNEEILLLSEKARQFAERVAMA